MKIDEKKWICIRDVAANIVFWWCCIFVVYDDWCALLLLMSNKCRVKQYGIQNLIVSSYNSITYFFDSRPILQITNTPFK